MSLPYYKGRNLFLFKKDLYIYSQKNPTLTDGISSQEAKGLVSGVNLAQLAEEACE